MTLVPDLVQKPSVREGFFVFQMVGRDGSSYRDGLRRQTVSLLGRGTIHLFFAWMAEIFERKCPIFLFFVTFENAEYLYVSR